MKMGIKNLFLLPALIAGLGLIPAGQVTAQTFTTLHNFAANTNGAGFTNLHTLVLSSDGGSPYAGVILSGNTLYGLANRGGSATYGTVFAVNTDGTGFTNLHTFMANSVTNTDGNQPYGGLIMSGAKLYGTASSGGSFSAGTVFAVNTDGTGFTN